MRSKFAGLWNFHDWEFTNSSTGKSSLPWEGKAVGEYRFDEHGRASVQMMRTDRPVRTAPGGPSWAAAYSLDERAAVMDGYLAYWGNYEIDEPNRMLNLQLLGATRPDWVGGLQQRGFEFSPDGNTLTLLYQTETGMHRLVWKRSETA